MTIKLDPPLDLYRSEAVGDDEHHLELFGRVTDSTIPEIAAYLRAARATRADGSSFRTALYAHNRATAAQAIIDNDVELPACTVPGATCWLDVLTAEARSLRLIAGMLDGGALTWSA